MASTLSMRFIYLSIVICLVLILAEGNYLLYFAVYTTYYHQEHLLIEIVSLLSTRLNSIPMIIYKSN